MLIHFFILVIYFYFRFIVCISFVYLFICVNSLYRLEVNLCSIRGGGIAAKIDLVFLSFELNFLTPKIEPYLLYSWQVIR